jgi:hypothetical protein
MITLSTMFQAIHSKKIYRWGRYHIMRNKRNRYGILMGKHEITRRFEMLTRILNTALKLILKGIRWESVEWIHLAQDRDKFRAF